MTHEQLDQEANIRNAQRRATYTTRRNAQDANGTTLLDITNLSHSNVQQTTSTTPLTHASEFNLIANTYIQLIQACTPFYIFKIFLFTYTRN